MRGLLGSLHRLEGSKQFGFQSAIILPRNETSQSCTGFHVCPFFCLCADRETDEIGVQAKPDLLNDVDCGLWKWNASGRGNHDDTHLHGTGCRTID